MPKIISIAVDKDFDLEVAVCGHGWYDLAPFTWDKERGELSTVFYDDKKRVAVGGVISSEKSVISGEKGVISGTGGVINVKLDSAKITAARIERDVRHILRSDEDLSEFYAAADGVPGIEWVGRMGAGRLLRSATVFEDVVKTMCTTNCSWSLTRKMVENLVSKLGASSSNGKQAFPTAEAMAEQDEAFYRREIKAGYRSPYFVELAESVASGKLDVEAFLSDELSTEDLKKEIKKIKGFGEYAADNLLKLLGRYDCLALDSWVRAKYYEKHSRGRVCSDKKIARHYAKFGEWRGLAIWCDMTEYWFAEGR